MLPAARLPADPVGRAYAPAFRCRHRALRCLAQAYDAGDILRACPSLPFVGAAGRKRLQSRAAAYEERSRSLRAMHFVPGNTQQMAADRIDLDRQLARGLHCVHMESDPSFAGDPADLLHRLQNAGLIIGHHHADQPGVGPQRPAYVLGRDNPLAIDRQELYLDPALPQSFDGMQHRVVLHRAGDDMIPGLHRTEDGQVVALRPAAGKDNFRRAAAEQPGNAGPRLFHCGTRVLPFLVDRRSVAELLQQKRTHSLQHLGQQRCGGIRIQVNSPHISILREHSHPNLLGFFC